VTLSASIVAKVRAALLSGELASGDFLGTEVGLAEKFGVSRIAMRDAMRSLAAIGVIDVRAGKRGGAWIAEGNMEHIANAFAIQLRMIGISELEMLDAQAALESHACELAAHRADAADLDHMRGLLRRLTELVDRPLEFTKTAMDLHTAFVEASHSRGLIVQFRALRPMLQRAYAGHTTRAIALKAIAAHRKVIAKIAAGDAEGARRAIAKRIAQIRASGFSNS
jgi:GntR family transcriptional regulator, transcriptional repressor for pyruvate dehydrogenase complex